METEGNPVEDAVVSEATEFLLHLFGDAEGVLLRPGGSGCGLRDSGWCSDAKDESGCKKRQSASSQMRKSVHWFTPISEK